MLFSVPIFFIVFRETLEAAIIISVLLGLAEQIIHEGSSSTTATTQSTILDAENDKLPLGEDSAAAPESETDMSTQRRLLVRKLRIQIFAGAVAGLFIAMGIGAAFIAVWFTKASNLWNRAENLWEGIFNLIASVLIFVMGISMLKMEKAKVKWRLKIRRALEGRSIDKEVKTGKWVLFFLPFVTVLREGMEAVVFVGGVALGQPAKSIPIAAIVGIVCGLVVGFFIYEFASRSTLTIFLVFMTNLLLLLGAGLFSKAVGNFGLNAYNNLLGKDVDDASGSGPGSYRVQGNVWHLDCCSPEDRIGGQGWTVFAAILGWTNSATLGTVLSYVFYWIAVMISLVYLKFAEGRVTLFGRESAAGARRRVRREEAAVARQVQEEKFIPTTPELDENDHEDRKGSAAVTLSERGVDELPR